MYIFSLPFQDENDEKSVKELKNEFEVMASLGRHPNLLWLLGMCYRTQENDTSKLFLQYMGIIYAYHNIGVTCIPHVI